MPKDEHQLIPHAGRALAKSGSLGGRILSEMIDAALSFSRKEEALVPRFKIGKHIFCEPDYQQIMLWAEILRMDPDEVLRRLLITPTEGQWEDKKTLINNGRIIRLAWSIKLLPIGQFEWINNLSIESVIFYPSHDFFLGLKHEKLRLALPLKNLRLFFCTLSILDELDISQSPRLENLTCANDGPAGGISELDLSKVPLLTELDCSGCRLKRLDLSPVKNIRHIRCSHNQITRLDFSSTPSLKSVVCCNNNLGSIDLSCVPYLESLSCNSTEITRIDISNVPNLKLLGCSWNALTEIDLSSVPLLEQLWCAHNKITNLNLSSAANLMELHCSNNRITELDLSAALKITDLDCSSNEIVELDIRPLRYLNKLRYDKGKTRLIQRADQNF